MARSRTASRRAVMACQPPRRAQFRTRSSDASIRASTKAAPTSRTHPPAPIDGSGTIVTACSCDVSPTASASAGFNRTTAPSLSGDSARARRTASRPGDEDSLSSRPTMASVILKASSAAARSRLCRSVSSTLGAWAIAVSRAPRAEACAAAAAFGGCLRLGSRLCQAGCVARGAAFPLQRVRVRRRARPRLSAALPA